MQNTSSKTYSMVVTALFAAIICVMTFTPLGYFPMAVGELTLLMIPVAIGALMLGPKIGAILGGVFGLTSFLCCFGIGHPSAFGAFVLNENFLFTAIICFIPRILDGFLVGLMGKWIANQKKASVKSVGYGVAGFLAAFINTVLFVGAVILFFWNNAAFQAKMTEWGISTKNLWAFIVAFATINALIEAVVCTVVTCAVCSALGASGMIRMQKKNA